MYQLDETEARRKHGDGPPEGSENIPHREEPRSEAGQPARRLRVVRAPGGFVFVDDEPATRLSMPV